MLQKFLCWLGHDWKMSTHIKEACSLPNGDTTYLYDRRCSRDDCGLNQRIAIVSLVGLGRMSFLEKEWRE